MLEEVLLILFGFGLIVLTFYFVLRAIFLPKPSERLKPVSAKKLAAQGKNEA